MAKKSQENSDNPFAQLKKLVLSDDKNNSKNIKQESKPKGAKASSSQQKAQQNQQEDMDDASSLFFAYAGTVQKLNDKNASKKKPTKAVKLPKTKEERELEQKQKEATESLNSSHSVNTIGATNTASTTCATSATKAVNVSESVDERLNLPHSTRFKDSPEQALHEELENHFMQAAIPQAFQELKKKAGKTEQASSAQSSKTYKGQASPLSKSSQISALNKDSQTPKQSTDEAEEELVDFFVEMASVTTMNGKGRDIPLAVQRKLAPPPVQDILQDVLDPKTEFSLNATDEYVEAHVIGLDLMTVGKLQSRQYSPEAHIDLHGLNSKQAYDNLIAFFRTSYQRGHRMVLVVTGRGNNSHNKTPVLRNKVQEWFIKDPFKRVILAFCSAKQEDGGAGALYVLIRKQKKDYGKVHWNTTPTDPDLFL